MDFFFDELECIYLEDIFSSGKYPSYNKCDNKLQRYANKLLWTVQFGLMAGISIATFHVYFINNIFFIRNVNIWFWIFFFIYLFTYFRYREQRTTSMSAIEARSYSIISNAVNHMDADGNRLAKVCLFTVIW